MYNSMNSSLNLTIRKQKAYLEQALSKSYVQRTGFAKAKKLVGTDLIKVVVGPRRAGKSVLSMLLLKDVKFAYLNLDEESLRPILRDMKSYDELLEEMLSVYGKTNVLLFDEIQNLDRWELFVNKLHREGYNLILTGSNSKLLSMELSTHLTGRHFEIVVLPFNFKEYLDAKGFHANSDSASASHKGELFFHLENYLLNGGYPEVTAKDLEVKPYLSTLFDSVILKDVVGRYKIRFPQKILTIGSLIINNVGNELSYRKLLVPLDVKSPVTAGKYAGFLEEAYLVFLLNKYSYKTKELFGFVKKAYVVDNGFVAAKAMQFSGNRGKLMENLVFGELVKAGFTPNKDLFYYRTESNKEVDFIVRQGTKVKSLMQVAYDTTSAKAEAREMKALVEASKELDCDELLLITWDEEGERKLSGKKIKLIPLYKWLLEKDAAVR